jgi:8-oxo-dGTP pyrophosphatase MutT (NUDIX family)
MRWTVHGERTIYDSPWVHLTLVDVEPPGVDRFEHHVVRLRPAAGCVITDPERGFLLLWRHRFITDSWGWEIPAGRVDEGEEPMAAAAREAFEETGWRPGPLRDFVRFNTANGLTDQRFFVYRAEGAEHVGEPHDRYESERIDWVTPERLRAEIEAGRVPDGPSLLALTYALAGLAPTAAPVAVTVTDARPA